MYESSSQKKANFQLVLVLLSASALSTESSNYVPFMERIWNLGEIYQSYIMEVINSKPSGARSRALEKYSFIIS
jgi:hypothetical protein